jgi:single-stranded-DNA-specific exonuclease
MQCIMTTLQGYKYLWKFLPASSQEILTIASSYNLCLPIAQTLLARGYTSKEHLDTFLFSSFDRDVACASRMKDAQKAVDRIIAAINNQEKILVAGDYDVDGITSSSLMMICLKPLGAQINFFLPHRVKDGYGLSTKVIERAASNNYKVVITVDNGITAFEPAQKAKELGIDLIITDHHKPHDHLPDAYAIINPHQHDCPYPFKTLAGVGVSFKILCLLYQKLKLELPPKAYELLLLGTIADVVPLLGENRFWVRHGLTYISRYESPSFKVLKQNGKLTKARLNASDIGFCITPQLNALGRLEDPRQGVNFLIGSDQAELERIGSVLFELNQARKEIERTVFESVQAQIAQGLVDLSKENIIVACSDQWPPGVIGLVASKIVGMYGKPTLLFHVNNKGKAKGSCRSVPGFNMFDALAQGSHLLDQFGGHAMAAGLSLSLDNLPRLKEHLETLIIQYISPAELQPKIVLDAQIQLSEVNAKFIADLQHLEPFGNENSSPLFYVTDAVLVQKPLLLKELHVKCMIFADGVIKPVIFFNRPELFPVLMAQEQTPFTLAVQVTENHWNGKIAIELTGIDIARQKGNV